MIGYLYIVGTVLFTVYGQLILKWRIAKYGALPLDFGHKIVFLMKLFLDPFIFSGFIAGFIASLFWMAAMTKFEISHAYPMIIGGLAIFTTFSSMLILNEAVTVSKVLGLLVVVVGIYILSR